ncbi:hypothetical protein NQ315_005728 [Exocentrus adspersus]|uniref:Uncharacterized protein n=1 Tax=Exocentrus adspersus TaxID=1586481 RepID=A0AAV8VIK0_9CUCU|nr:hypothetical protein NQ315_005728 [Exocentrus adspersus]
MNKQTSNLRPIRRPKENSGDQENTSENYAPKNVFYEKKDVCLCKRIPHLSEVQAFNICAGANKEFYDSLRLTKEVFHSMRSDEISKIAMGDVLICSYGESELKKHKRTQIRSTVSNKMRELGRLLLVLRQTTGVKKFIDILKPDYFDNIVDATKTISGYDAINKTFKASSLALHMGTRLKQICDIATKLIIKKNRLLPCDDQETTLKTIKRLRKLIEHHWSSELSSLALNDLKEKNWEKPKLLPLTKDVMHFQKYVTQEATRACDKIKQNENCQSEYRTLTECVLALVLLLNRKQEFLESLSESEKLLSQSFRQVVTGGKGTRPVAILFPKKIQEYIDVMLSVRQKYIPDTNEYLFANSNTENRWLSGYHVLRKLADKCGVNNKELLTSTRLRKQIATVLQILNVNEKEMEQFANFMGHTKKTHEEYYRLPQDVYETAKVSKLLLAVNNGKGALYKGKTLDEIEFSDNVQSDDSDEESQPTSSNITANRKKTKEEFTKEDASEDVKAAPTKERQKKTKDVKEDFNEDFSSESDSDSDIESDSESETVKKRKTQIKRVKWTDQEKAKIFDFFKDHIQNKIVPKKQEVEKFRKANKKLFEERNWIRIKAFVYNCLQKKSKQ